MVDVFLFQMAHHTQKVKDATCDWFWADGPQMEAGL